MSDSSDKSSVRSIRWIARVFGTLIGLMALMEFLEGFAYLGQLETRGYMLRVGFFLVFAGGVVGWFREFTASLLILGGAVLIGVMTNGPPAAKIVLILPALIGFLYLYVHLAQRKS